VLMRLTREPYFEDDRFRGRDVMHWIMNYMDFVRHEWEPRMLAACRT
jgi:hypothetical protein